ncbi:MAG: hypothetical protein GEV08_12770, partial [Acidimicrobiia bacterium]|nr:hypothetical protein [Acidimicrobiia bacterium]
QASGLVHHRPPRSPLPGPPEAVELPRPPVEGPARPTLALASAALPAVAGLAIVAVTGNWLFAVLPLMSPVLAVAAWWQGRRHVARVSRREWARHAAEVATLERALAASGAQEQRRRRALGGDLAETVRRACLPSARLWERRPGDADFLRLVAGEADVAWSPPVVGSAGASSSRVAEVVAASAVLRDVPVEVDLGDGGVVGVVGPLPAARAVARGLLLHAVVHHGPADLEVVVVTAPDGASQWSWARWLPHCLDRRRGARLVLEGPADAPLLAELAEVPAEPDGPVRLFVVDDEAQLAARRSPLRVMLKGAGGPVAGIVVASRRDRLPASCTAVVELEGADGAAEVDDLRAGRGQRGVLVAGLGAGRAAAAARSLARFEDAEAPVPAGRRAVGLADLLGRSCLDPGCVAATWAANWAEPGLAVPLGADGEGAVPVDLVLDGPHALVAGTTGAGKSELLRSWVAALAATVDPRLLAIVLVDYKGGAAFDACAALPHVAAVVTDLDAALGARALRGLDAELRRRERCLRDAGVADLAAHRRLGVGEPLPRLLVVVDEFATLAAELPDFLDALVGVAQRGRSLGVHLVLATQRPAGVVNDAIRANTNLRVALRVQDAHDALDVVGSDLPARLPRHRPGAAVLRLGPNELVSVQVAHASAPARLGKVPRVEVLVNGALRRAGELPGAGAGPGVDASAGPRDGCSQLDLVVAACREAASRLGLEAQRPPWPEPLPGVLTFAELAEHAERGPSGDVTGAGLAALWLADDPDHQARHVGGWRPTEGNLLVYGGRGSGTTTALVSAVVAVADRLRPDELHVYGVDGGGGGLDALEGLPHTGAVLRLGDSERLARLLERLGAELEARRAPSAAGASSARPMVVLVVDGLASLAAELDQPGSLALSELFQRWFLDGPQLGLLTLASADRPGSVRHQLAAATAQRLVLELADPLDARALGIAATGGPPGRGVELASGHAVQVAVAAPAAIEAVARRLAARPGGAPGAAPPVGRLPDRVGLAGLLGAGAVGERPWRIPVGVGAHRLETACLELHGGEHALIAGPARSGRTTALVTIAAALHALRGGAEVVAVLPRPSALGDAPLDRVLRPDELDLLTALVPARPLVVLVDDAELVEDPNGALERLVASRDELVSVIAAGRADALRSSYGPWLRLVRQSRAGLLLVPDADLDGDLLSIRLPRRHAARLYAGRGYLVQAGDAELVQVAAVCPQGSEELWCSFNESQYP